MGNLENQYFRGKTVLLVNTGTLKKKFTLQILKKLGLNLVVLNKEINWANSLVDNWIICDTSNHNEAVGEVEKFIQEKDINIDGVLTFWEDDVLLTSKIIDRLGVIGIPFEIAKKTRNKFLFRQFCKDNNLPVPNFKLIKDFDDIENIKSELTFPVVIKPAFGAASLFVIKTDDLDELKFAYNYIKSAISVGFDSVFSDGVDIVVEEYIDGNEVDIDIIIQNGRIKFFSISDNDKTNEPFFVETGQAIPSRLPVSSQDALINMADEVLEKMGIQDGCIHFEAKYSNKGPIPIEVNIRMGGDEVYSFVKGAWHFDLVENAARVALGIHVKKVIKPELPFNYLAGRYFLPDYSGVLVQFTKDQKIKKKKYIKDVCFFKKVGDTVLVPPEGFESLGWITVSGYNSNDAQANLNEAYKYVKYDIAKFDDNSSLGKTLRKKSFSYFINNNPLKQRSIAKIKQVSIKNQRNLNICIAYNSLYNFSPNEENMPKKIYNILSKCGYSSLKLVDFSNPFESLKYVQKSNFDLILNLYKSNFGSCFSEAGIAGMFEFLQVPYTGSNQSTLSLCADKIKIKKLLSFHNIPTPRWDYVCNMNEEVSPDLKFPLIVKPFISDNSIGITNDSVVTNKVELKSQIEKIITNIGSPVLVEEYIGGDEYDVSILGNEYESLIAFPHARSLFNNLPNGYWHIYPYEAKYNQDEIYKKKIIVQIPPKGISKKLSSLISEIAIDTYSISDCRDYGTVEIRVDKNDNPYVLEINPNPSIYHNSFFEISARAYGYSFEEVLEEIIYMTINRYKKSK